jgi:hypothetical protein
MIHKYLVIDKSLQFLINQFCNEIGAIGETFTTCLYTEDVHTHYWSGWLMTEDQYNAVILNPDILVFNSYQEALSLTGTHIHQEVEV